MKAADDLLEDVKNTQRMSEDWKKKIDHFINSTKEVVFVFLGESDHARVGGYNITLKHPWFLSKKYYGKELEIKINNKVILSWLENGSGYRSHWQLQTFDYDNIENVKDFLLNLQSVMDIDLLEIKFDGLERDEEKKFERLKK